MGLPPPPFFCTSSILTGGIIMLRFLCSVSLCMYSVCRKESMGHSLELNTKKTVVWLKHMAMTHFLVSFIIQHPFCSRWCPHSHRNVSQTASGWWHSAPLCLSGPSYLHTIRSFVHQKKTVALVMWLPGHLLSTKRSGTWDTVLILYPCRMWVL